MSRRPRAAIMGALATAATGAMSHVQTSGDCNSCHTTAGINAAPRRVMAP